MVRWFSFRFIRTSSYRLLCRRKYVILVTLATVAFYFFPPIAWPVQEIEKLFETEPSSRHFSQNVSGQFTSYNNDASIPSANKVTSDIAKTMARGYLMQRAPALGLRLGNQMFMFASLLGIADHAKMTPAYSKDLQLRQIFKISAGSPEVEAYIQIYETQACAFDSRLFSLANTDQNATVIGYLQSWKYFSNITERIIQEFTFNDELRVQADEFLENILANMSTSVEFIEVLFIGVHIRRKDMLINIDQGFTVASKDYLAVAVNHFRTNFPASTLIFVVCGDEPDWSKQNFPMIDRNSFLTFSESRTAAEDMAILAACNHTIMTVGTFGWWSAYLAGGQTIYYKDFPTTGSNVDNVFKKEDFFPPHWIGL